MEQELIGLDYARVGGALMRQWGLPKSLQEATEFHVEPGRAQEFPLETAIIHLAAQVAEATSGGDVIETRISLVDASAWLKGVNRLTWASSAMPMPSSAISRML